MFDGYDERYDDEYYYQDHMYYNGEDYDTPDDGALFLNQNSDYYWWNGEPYFWNDHLNDYELALFCESDEADHDDYRDPSVSYKFEDDEYYSNHE